MIFSLLGVLSAIIFLIGDYPYFTDTLKGKTQPHRVTWGVVFLLNIIGFANQYASGADNSLWLFGASVIAVGAIFIASLFKGVGGHSKQDIISIVLSIFGVILWVIFDNPLFSIFANIFVGFVALYPTFKKAKIHPESETRITWLLGSVSSFLATISVGELNFQLLLLPIFSTLVQSYMVYLLYFYHKKAD